ncbi:MAG: DUF1353 domain-containing protein [Candidatus Competibacteraceae bacterium]|nr:DUF1353 domain-containing protein [Candidatus Competibacteraceae bacterium]
MMNKQAFPDPLIVSYIDGRRWMLQAPFRYIDSKYGAITAPTGFITDYASIPRLGWSILGAPEQYALASIVHDCLYSIQSFPRATADGIFYRGLIESGIDEIRAALFYAAVRCFGCIGWNSKELI